MKLACLVLAYNGASVLARALPILAEAGLTVFVHLDRKANREHYRQILGEPGRGCVFIEDPLDIHWGGYTMMQAELRLLATARAAGPYDKYLLISDDAFPVVPAPQLRDHLSTCADLISAAKQGKASYIYGRYHDFYCLDHPTTSIRGDARTGIIDEALEQKISEIAVLRRIGKKAIEVYWGSQFWALGQASVDLVLRLAAEDRHLAKSFEYAALPDELMIQSIIGNYTSHEALTTGPVYADLSQPGGPRIVATEKDLPFDLQPSHLFLRKIAPGATDLLDGMLVRLRAGKRIDGRGARGAPIGRRETDASGRELLIVRLCAPSGSPGAGWHGLESFGGRGYRWTGAERIEWCFNEVSLPPGRIRFVITPVIDSGPEFIAHCRLSFAGETRPLDVQGGVLSATFEHGAASPVRVLLTTPRPISPREARGFDDDRPLGLSIAT
jgi:hypothetical protein